MTEALETRDLWLALKARNMPFKTEIEMSNIILNEVNLGCQDTDKIKPIDIYQYKKITTREPLWIIYCATSTVKHRILASSTIYSGT